MNRSTSPTHWLETSEGDRTAGELYTVLVKVFPFILVMWSAFGRGTVSRHRPVRPTRRKRRTMETLLISPASREEIVWGKFLTIWVFKPPPPPC